jgi:hypothetical protein
VQVTGPRQANGVESLRRTRRTNRRRAWAVPTRDFLRRFLFRCASVRPATHLGASYGLSSILMRGRERSSKTQILIARQSLLLEEATVNPAGAAFQPELIEFMKSVLEEATVIRSRSFSATADRPNERRVRSIGASAQASPAVRLGRRKRPPFRESAPSVQGFRGVLIR